MISKLADRIRPDSSILIVDDDEINRGILRELLESENCHVTEAATGAEALARVAENCPDTILLDILMPGMDGLEVCRRLRASDQTAAVPVILVSGERNREDQIAATAAGANGFITKPIDVYDLRLRVRTAVAAKKLYDRIQSGDQNTA